MGVREGSVFGPGFFICGMCGVRVVVKRVRIEMEEVGLSVEITCLEFADDTSGLIVARDEAELQIVVHLMMEKFRHLSLLTTINSFPPLLQSNNFT